jgi:HPt (histidine-containing phosphotransfer) domain-containing protein
MSVNVSGQVTTPAKLVSALLADDPDLYDIVAAFVDGLAGRITELRQAYDRLDWDQLTILAHRLKGAGGSYGYPDLSTLGATMERSFRTQSADHFSTWIKQLEELSAAACAGLPAN